MKIPKMVMVFGTKYDVYLLNEPNKTMLQNSLEGYVDYDKQAIYILNAGHAERVYHHELIHAYINESGHNSLSCNEYVIELFTEIYERMRLNEKDI